MPARLSIRWAVAALLVGFVSFLPVQAQSPVRLAELNVAIWPEYDKEGVLVIYRGRLADDVALPVTLELLIPREAGKPSSTAGVDANGEFRYRSYQTIDMGDSVAVTYTNPYRVFQMEYYYNPLTVTGAARSFTYSFKADYAIDNLTIEVKEPAGSANMTLTPVATETASDFDGLTLQRYPVGALEAGQTFELTASYEKTDPRLSSEILNLPEPGEVAFEDVTTSKDNSLAYILLGAAVALLVGAAVYAYMQSRRRPRLATAKPSKPRQKPKKVKRAREEATAVAAYCHNCGNRLRPGDAFCAKCGTKVKQR